MSSKSFGNRIRLVTYVNPDVYEKLEAERIKTGESESGIVNSILSCFVKEACEQ
jgi:hypothetical protein